MKSGVSGTAEDASAKSSGATTAAAPERLDLDTFTYDELVDLRQKRSLRALPALLRSSIRLITRAARREFVAVAVLQLVSSLLAAAQLLAIRQLLTRVVNLGKTAGAGEVLPWAIVVVTLLTISAIINLARGELQKVVTDLLSREAQEDVVRAASAADLIDFDRSAFHNRLERVLANSTFRPMQLATALIGMVGSLLAMVAVAITVAMIQPALLLVALAGSLPIVLATRAATLLNIDFEIEQTEVSRQRHYLLHLLSQKDTAKEVRGYNLASYLTSRHSGLWSARIKRLREVGRRRFAIGTIARLISGVVMGGTLAVLIRLLEQGTITIAESAVAAGAIVLLAQRAQSLIGGFGMIFECTTFLHEVDQFLGDAANRRAEMSARAHFDLAADEPLTVRSDRLGFRYPNAPNDAVVDVSVTVRTGEVVALVGANGSGKTTLAKLLGGLYVADRGTVSWNGSDIQQMDDVSVREHVAFVFQDYTRFFFSAAENIGFGRWQHADDREAVREAARDAGAADFLEEFPAGYDTLLAPQFTGGRDLSLGQWQRVAIARAFFRKAALVVLDEPSSSLDPDAEAALFGSLRQLCAGKAVIVISHRFSTVSSADRIYVLDAGHIVESGTHRALLELDGTYARLFNLQAAAYQPGEPV